MSFLAISASKSPYLAHAQEWLKAHFHDAGTILIIPDAVPQSYRLKALAKELEDCGVGDAVAMAGASLARVLADKEVSADIMASATEAYAADNEAFFKGIGIDCVSAHRLNDPVRALYNGAFGGIYIGGGSIVDLTENLQASGLFNEIKERALEGMPVAGASAAVHLISPEATATTVEQPYDGRELPELEGMGLIQSQFVVHADPENMGGKRAFATAYFEKGGVNPVIVLPENGALVIPVTEAEKYGELAAHISILGEDGVEVVSPGNHIQAQKGQMSPLFSPPAP